MGRLFIGVLIAVLTCGPARAQQQAPAQQPPPQQQTAADPPGPDSTIFIPPKPKQPDTTQTNSNSAQPGTTSNGSANGSKNAQAIGSNDRLFFILPNYGTLQNAGSIQPLTVKQKFDIQWRNCFDPVVFPYVGLLAGISQMDNSDPGYGQGALGYAKRYGAAFVDSTDENFMVGAVYPSLFREDPRYFRMGKGGFFHRAGYSISRIFVTRTDAGRTVPNFSEFVGSATAATIGTTYRVGNERTVDDAAGDWGTLVGWDAVANLLKEFWPDIRHPNHHKSANS